MQSCVHSFFFARPTDPPSREGGRWEAKHFIGMAQENLRLMLLSNNIGLEIITTSKALFK